MQVTAFETQTSYNACLSDLDLCILLESPNATPDTVLVVSASSAKDRRLTHRTPALRERNVRAGASTVYELNH